MVHENRDRRNFTSSTAIALLNSFIYESLQLTWKCNLRVMYRCAVTSRVALYKCNGILQRSPLFRSQLVAFFSFQTRELQKLSKPLLGQIIGLLQRLKSILWSLRKCFQPCQHRVPPAPSYCSSFRKELCIQPVLVDRRRRCPEPSFVSTLHRTLFSVLIPSTNPNQLLQILDLADQKDKLARFSSCKDGRYNEEKPKKHAGLKVVVSQSRRQSAVSFQCCGNSKALLVPAGSLSSSSGVRD